MFLLAISTVTAKSFNKAIVKPARPPAVNGEGRVISFADQQVARFALALSAISAVKFIAAPGLPLALCAPFVALRWGLLGKAVAKGL